MHINGRIHTFAKKEGTAMDKKAKKRFVIKMIEDKKAIVKAIRAGVPVKTIEKERNVKFVTPV